MKKISLLVLSCLMTILLSAAPVGQQTAQKAGVKFLTSVKHMRVSAADCQLAYVASSERDNAPCFYVFNAGNGFVMVSGDDCIRPILGYSTENDFVAENMPDNIKGYLQNYVLQIDAAKDQNLEADAETQREWEALLSESAVTKSVFDRNVQVVTPLLTTTWNQDDPYNDLCPTASSGPGGHVYAGCVATAMAQVIRFWSFPTIGTGSHSYYHSTYGTQSANFGNTTYQYSLMPNNIYTSSPSSQINAIATLIYHCAVSVDMDFSPEGSAASSSDAAVSLRTYFGYSDAMYVNRSNYSETNWINLLKAELEAGRPMIYRGSSEASGGHSFVCDGFDNDDFFHFNWGWSGSGNGYYSINNMNPEGFNFNEGQGAVIHIEANSNCDAPTGLTATASNNNINLTWEGVFVGSWISWSGENQGNAIGTGSAANFDVAHRYATSDLTSYNGMTLSKIKFFPNEAACSYSVRVWTGGNVSGPASLVVDQAVSDVVIGQWNEVTLNSPVTINASQELWFGYNCNTTTGHPAGCDAGPQISQKGNMMYFNGTWCELSSLGSTLTFNWCIQGYVGSIQGDAVALTPLTYNVPQSTGTLSVVKKEIQPVIPTRDGVTYNVFNDGVLIAENISTTSYTDANLSSGTYCYTVKTVCENGLSEASNTACATIGGGNSCTPPTNLTATANSSKINLAWNAPVDRDVLLYEGFESGSLPSGWSVIDADGDGYNWDAVSLNGIAIGHSGECISSASYLNNIGALTPNNYLITPMVTGATSVNYWINAQDASYAYEHYAVCASSTGTNASNFSIVFEETMTAKSGAKGNRGANVQGTWYERNVNLPAGTKYVAFRHYNCTDAYWLNLDDVTVNGSNAPSDLIYNVYRDGVMIAANIEGEAYSDNNIASNVEYCYTVTHACTSGESDHSNEACSMITGISELDNAYQIFPNPANNKVTIEGENIESITIYNVLGQMIDNINVVSQDSHVINTVSYESGMYIFRIVTHEGNIATKRVVIAR